MHDALSEHVDTIELSVWSMFPSFILSSSCGAEQASGVAVPPVSPEVINILLLQRSCRMHDALSEHVDTRELSVWIMFPSSILSSSCGAEQASGVAVPPVSPEVINILLLQRSCRMHDALSEHVDARELSVWSMFPSSILSSSCGAEQASGVAVPPVSPEVINILHLQRSCRMHDALSEHVDARKSLVGLSIQNT